MGGRGQEEKEEALPIWRQREKEAKVNCEIEEALMLPLHPYIIKSFLCLIFPYLCATGSSLSTRQHL